VIEKRAFLEYSLRVDWKLRPMFQTAFILYRVLLPAGAPPVTTEIATFPSQRDCAVALVNAMCGPGQQNHTPEVQFVCVKK
jgi:hypothetical protein